ncbi:hypothetical protein GCM10017783_24210 [Deinococcus piscis]|uniref:CHAD domain-containing protein n=1 Tax=Deinococcus piscis TaxID=394230 RepID=A0ABQ3KHG4_9DEIO|nr:CHAD domain-containing protein [Deinococcus piscis]GHG10965.1 hypothetical protein GCM10017783_24210 [Deinococcus piscis]
MPKTSKADPNKRGAQTPTRSQAQPSDLRQQLAEYWPDFQAASPKAVHEVRKLTRRAGAEAKVSDLSKRVRREWRDLRRAAAPIRDHDAAGEHLRAALAEMKASPTALKRFEAAWAGRRAALLAAHPLPAQMPGGYDLPADWEKRAKRALKADRKALLGQGKALMKAADTNDSEAWHDWRKLMKRYRYTLELVGKAPREVRDMLEHLGRLQDAEVLLDLLQSEGQHFGKAQLRALQQREEQARVDARAAARALWPQLKAHLKGESQPKTAPDQPTTTTEVAAADRSTSTKKAPAAKATAAAKKTTARRPASKATATSKDLGATAKTPAKRTGGKASSSKAATKPATAKRTATTSSAKGTKAATPKAARSAPRKPATSRRKTSDSSSDS